MHSYIVCMSSAILNILCVGLAVYGYRKIMTSMKENHMSTQAAIDAVVAQLGKALNEITGKLEEATSAVQAQLVDAGVAESVDLSALSAIAQQLDDLVPDVEAVVEAEVEVVDEVEVEVEDEVEVVDEVEVDEVEDEVEDEDEAVDEEDEGSLVDLTEVDDEV